MESVVELRSPVAMKDTNASMFSIHKHRMTGTILTKFRLRASCYSWLYDVRSIIETKCHLRKFWMSREHFGKEGRYISAYFPTNGRHVML